MSRRPSGPPEEGFDPRCQNRNHKDQAANDGFGVSDGHVYRTTCDDDDFQGDTKTYWRKLLEDSQDHLKYDGSPDPEVDGKNGYAAGNSDFKLDSSFDDSVGDNRKNDPQDDYYDPRDAATGDDSAQSSDEDGMGATHHNIPGDKYFEDGACGGDTQIKTSHGSSGSTDYGMFPPEVQKLLAELDMRETDVRKKREEQLEYLKQLDVMQTDLRMMNSSLETIESDMRQANDKMGQLALNCSLQNAEDVLDMLQVDQKFYETLQKALRDMSQMEERDRHLFDDFSFTPVDKNQAAGGNFMPNPGDQDQKAAHATCDPREVDNRDKSSEKSLVE